MYNHNQPTKRANGDIVQELLITRQEISKKEHKGTDLDNPIA